MCDPTKMMSEIIFYALMFIVIGAGIGISMFCQVRTGILSPGQATAINEHGDAIHSAYFRYSLTKCLIPECDLTVFQLYCNSAYFY